SPIGRSGPVFFQLALDDLAPPARSASDFGADIPAAYLIEDTPTASSSARSQLFDGNHPLQQSPPSLCRACRIALGDRRRGDGVRLLDQWAAKRGLLPVIR